MSVSERDFIMKNYQQLFASALFYIYINSIVFSYRVGWPGLETGKASYWLQPLRCRCPSCAIYTSLVRHRHPHSLISQFIDCQNLKMVSFYNCQNQKVVPFYNKVKILCIQHPSWCKNASKHPNILDPNMVQSAQKKRKQQVEKVGVKNRTIVQSLTMEVSICPNK